MDTKGITLTLINSKDRINRKFDPQTFLKSDLWQQAEVLLNDEGFVTEYANALAQIHRKDPSKVLKVVKDEFALGRAAYTTPEPMQSYWTDLFHTLQLQGKKGDQEYLMGVKACRNHYFYNLRGEVKGKGVSPLLCAPFFEKSAPPEDASKVANLRGLTDTVLFLAPELSQHRQRLVDYLSWFDLTLCCNVSPRQSSGQLTIKIRPQFNRLSKCIILGKKPILVISPNFRKAVSDLSEVWLNPRAKSVLLCGWTGSGKEVLVDILTYAMRIGDKNRVNTSAAALKQFEKLTDKMRAYQKPLLLRREGKKRKDKRSILFIDEIHHKSVGPFRSGLLRHLSTGKLEVDAEEMLCDAVLYVLAASEQPKTLREKTEPKDLWTRMEHTVTLEHPLYIQKEEGEDEERQERQDVLRGYFLFFWHRYQEDYVKSTHVNAYPTVEIFFDLGKETKEDQSIFEMLAAKFVEKMDSPLLPLMSIRSLEIMVKRLFYRTQTYVRRNPSETQAEELEQKFGEWVVEIRKELIPELEFGPLKTLLGERGIF